MAEETNYYIKYKVGKTIEDAKDVTPDEFKNIEKLMKPEDKKEHDKYREDLGDSNADNSRSWVE